MGVPVVPDVKTIATGRSGSGGSGRLPSSGAEGGEQLVRLVAPLYRDHLDAVIGAGEIVGGQHQAGLARSSTTSRSAAARRWFTPAVMAPSRAAAA